MTNRSSSRQRSLRMSVAAKALWTSRLDEREKVGEENKDVIVKQWEKQDGRCAQLIGHLAIAFGVIATVSVPLSEQSGVIADRSLEKFSQQIPIDDDDCSIAVLLLHAKKVCKGKMDIKSTSAPHFRW